MKKIILVVFAILMASDLIFAENIEKMSMSPNLIITITINLHSKKSNCTTGFGFCKISVGFSWDTDAPAGGGLPGKLSLDPNDNLILKISEADLQKYESGSSLKYFKGMQSIKVDETYELNKEISNSLATTKNLVIKPGEYSVKYDGSSYTVVVPQ